MSGKILIVDQLATNRIVLKVKLSATPYKVLQAATAQEALDIAARERPDLILSNSTVSGLALHEFVAALRGLDHHAASGRLLPRRASRRLAIRRR
jgi:two-component system cell cycle response regulator